MNIFFSGIGGVGLGPLAEIAHDAGYEILGSDLESGLMTEHLKTRGISVHLGPQDGSFLRTSHEQKPIDWFIYTAALPSDHPELLFAKSLGIRVAKRDELLAHIISEKNLKLIAITGTHGKTTTTGMLIWALKQLNIPVSYSIGTTINFGPSGYFDPNSEYFVYECDEFDRNFLTFSPFLSLITAVDHDHYDTYPTEAEYLDAFRKFVSQSHAVLTWSDQHADAYEGLEQVRLLTDQDIDQTIRLPGAHNRRNATLVEYSMRHLGINADYGSILSTFPGTDRRFELLAPHLYSDYGHHPIEIAATLQLARELSDHIILVYQPHQNVRQHEIRRSYTNQFELADEVYWLPTYLSREDPNLPILSPEELVTHITNRDHVHIADFNDELWDIIQTARDEGKLVLGMGAGAIDKWLRENLAR